MKTTAAQGRLHGVNSGGGGGGRVELTGDDGANTLTGGSGDDRLTGLGGDDLLTGGAGADRLDGSSGNDTINAGSGSDEVTGGAGADVITSDNSALGGRADVKIDDRGGDNQITALGGAHTRIDIRTGSDADTISVTGAERAEIRGGAGADSISVDGHIGDLRLALGGGGQTVTFGADLSFDKLRLDHFGAGDTGDVLKIRDYLSAHLTGWDASASPNAEGFVQLVTNGDHTVLQIDADGGGDGFTSLLRLGGDAAAFTAHNFEGLALTVGAGDVFQGDDVGDDHGGTTGNDTLHGGGGDDSLHGGDGSDDLLGGAGDDHLDGGKGDDHIEGGGGNDDLSGGKGADHFVFTVADGSTVVISDFEAHKDVIDVSGIDADPGAAGDQAFTFVDAFTDAAGQATLSFDSVSHTTTAAFDVDGDGVADLTLQIAGHVTADLGWAL